MTQDQMRSMPSGELINAMAKEINTGNPALWVTEAVIEKHKLTFGFTFVPFSASRNKKETHKSLNWTYIFKQDDRKILSGDYMQGCGHAPASKMGTIKNMRLKQRLIDEQCETGKEMKHGYGDNYFSGEKCIPVPLARDVLSCLLLDASVLGHTSFASWASDFGYEVDSRSAEKTYNECIKIGLALNAIGAIALAELREAFQEY
jgi:hypothetical protein